MKVLFAISNEEISESIVKKYQAKYKQIISSKNVYYFNAILKEIQKDKTYDRIVISEDLEAFTHSQYDQIDKFIFDKLDSISDEASNGRGKDIPIILICTDRREKSEQILVKLFGIGVYNALIGQDRSVEEVCRLLNRPRTKKEAKEYYKIDSEGVNYLPESENDVSEVEIQNILAHYKKLGKNEDQYVESFNNIAEQYNDKQLRIISKVLPLNVRAVLEEKSPKYQKVMSFSNTISDDLRRKQKQEGPTSKLLASGSNKVLMSKPVIIPSEVNMGEVKKLAKNKRKINIQPTVQPIEQSVEKEEIIPPEEQQPITSSMASQRIQVQNNRHSLETEQQVQPQTIKPIQPVERQPIQTIQPVQPVQPVQPKPIETQEPQFDELLSSIETPELEVKPIEPQGATNTEPINVENTEQKQPKKRGRGRPRKNPVVTEDSSKPKRGRGRPRKNPLPTVEETNQVEPKKEEQPVIQPLENVQSIIQPVRNVEPIQSINQGQVIEPELASAVEPIKPQTDKTVQTTEQPVEPVQPIQTAEPVKPIQPIQPAEPVKPIQTIEPQPVQPIQPIESKPVQPIQPIEPQPVQPIQPIEPKPVQPIQTRERQQTVQNQNFDYLNNISKANVEKQERDYSYNYTGISSDKSRNEYVNTIDISSLLTPDKKVVSFLGTSKNGTSFIVNNLAELASSMGIKTAILDTTTNKNSYYIYTKNEEGLREIALNSFENLVDKQPQGIKANKNLTVFTSLPGDDEKIEMVDEILETLVKNYSLVLIDTDFNTPIGYFKQSQELYLVQSLDILTIQPLTAFLRKLKSKNVLEERKIRIVINKAVKVRGIQEKTIIGGMAYYTDPAMSYMTELFDRNTVKYITIPFEDDTYIRYLENIINCEISLKGYSKAFMQSLKELANMVYPLVSGGYRPPSIK